MQCVAAAGLFSMPSTLWRHSSLSLSLSLSQAALFYACSSLLIIVVNKIALTTYQFPSSTFLALAQFAATAVALPLMRHFKLITFAEYSHDKFRLVHPLPLLFFVSVVSGLWGTKLLSVTMFTTLRRIGIWLTVVAEYYLLGIVSSTSVKISLAIMTAGALVSAAGDLAFNASGYLAVAVTSIAGTV